MSAILSTTQLDFQDGVGATQNLINASVASTIDFEGVGGADVTITGVDDLTASGTVQGGTLTDGTLSSTAGAVTGATSITASGTVQGGTLTDGTFSVNAGAVTGATTVAAGTSVTTPSVVVDNAGTTTSVSRAAGGVSHALVLPNAQGAASTFLQNDGAGNLSWATPGGGGDVSGPGASTDNAMVRWDGATGTLVQNSGVILDDTDNITGVAGFTATGTVQGGTLTDGTLSSTAGAVTGATSVTASGTVQGGTLTDGTVSVNAGAVTGAVSLQVDNAGTTTTVTRAAGGVSHGLVLPNAQGAASTFLQNDGAGNLSWATPGGGGDVSGPGASTDTALVRWDGATGTLVADSVVTLTGTDMTFPDSVNLVMGAGGDLTMVHDGADSSLTSITGNLLVDNQNVTGSTIIRLGTATAATNFQVQDTASQPQLTIDGTGLCTFQGVGNGTLSYDFGAGFVNIQDTTAAGAGTGALVCAGGADFAGSVRAQSHVSTSDVALKKNIKGLTNPLDTLMKVEGYSYDWKKPAPGCNKHQWGLIAQQLEEIGLGHMVEGTEGEKAVNYLALIPLLVEAVKELASICTEEV